MCTSLKTTTIPRLDVLISSILVHYLLLSSFFFLAPGVLFSVLCCIVPSIMAKEYRDVSMEEEELLTEEIGASSRFWRSEKDYLAKRIQMLSSRWLWFAHAILLFTSITFFALSLSLRSSARSDSIPVTYCTFN
jgi:hypothetical protein